MPPALILYLQLSDCTNVTHTTTGLEKYTYSKKPDMFSSSQMIAFLFFSQSVSKKA